MDTSYSVKQYFKMDLSEDYSERDLELLLLVRDQLLDLAVQHLTGQGLIYELAINLDGKKTYFGQKDKLISLELQESILQILAADQIEIRADYYYESLFSDHFTLDDLDQGLPMELPLHPAGPLFIDIFLDDAPDELIDKLVFSYHLIDDHDSDSSGVLVHYDKDFKGLVEEEAMDQLEGDFCFKNCSIPVFIDDYELDPSLKDQVMSHVRKLEEEAQESNLKYQEGLLNFHLEEIEITSNQELDSFIYHTSKLMEILGPDIDDNPGIFITPACFVDFTGNSPRAINIFFDKEGNYELNHKGI